ncbi:MAG: RNA polymerase sporulation sigma factor SigK [Clostridia bacterium]|nr:RNA polymerase sporulation sigma factor SigK [Clostridia bacterium]
MLPILLFAAANFAWFILYIQGENFKKPLSAKEEKEYLIKAKEGDKEAKNLLIIHNLRLVAHIVKKYYSSTNDQDDLISIGTIGLIKAINSFDYTKPVRLSTYASKCIENEILMHLRNQKKLVNEVYISDPIDTDKEGNVLTLMDIIITPDNILDTVYQNIRSEKLLQCIENLSQREREIIIYRYGLLGLRPLPQREVGKKLGISRSYVSRIEKKALQDLKHMMGKLSSE